jgi:hypothetical protein
MSFDLERLYNLLPVIYRLRDVELARQFPDLLTASEEAELQSLLASAAPLTEEQNVRLGQLQELQQRGPLKAVLSVIAEQIAVLEEDLAQLYDDQFIETCADWAVPYIGDLIGYRSLYGVTAKTGSPRAEVANTIAFRRRKGTSAVLEQLARDVTGWVARVVEFFELLPTTQYMNHLRPFNLSTPDLRRSDVLEYLQTPFDSVAHTLDVRRIEHGRGRYNIPNIGIFLWRLQAYEVTGGTPMRINAGAYTFHPLGIDAPLFNPGKTEDEITHIAEPVNAPEPLRRRPLYTELEARRQSLADGKTQTFINQQRVYFDDKPPFFVLLDGVVISPEQLLICDLSDWHRPSGTKDYQPADAGADPVGFEIKAAVDPVLGRLTLSDAIDVSGGGPKVEVDYAYGFSFEMGGGGYSRTNLSTPTENLSFADALSGNGAGPEERIFEINNSATLDGDLAITIGSGQRLTIQAKDRMRPVINGSITITSAADSQITLDGLLISKHIKVEGNAPLQLKLRHCTVVPWSTLGGDGQPQPLVNASVDWQTNDSSGTLILDHTITGKLLVDDGVRVEIHDSIVDALQDDQMALSSLNMEPNAGIVEIVRSTIIGRINVREIELGENSIFTGAINSQRKQQGCIRFCYLPLESTSPRRYYCQPELAIRQAVDQAKSVNPNLPDSAVQRISNEVRSWLLPVFTGLTYGQPSYMQLHTTCPAEIRTGADDESEMGAFHDLYQLRRETNLRARLDEYLRFGLEAGIFYAT